MHLDLHIQALSRRLVALTALIAVLAVAAIGASTADASAPADGKYRITTGATGHTNVLDAAGDFNKLGTPVINWPWHGGSNQQWYIEKISALPDGTPTYMISSVRDPNFCLDVSGASQANRAPVALWTCNYQFNQQFFYRDNPSSKSGSFIPRHSPGKALTMPLETGGQMYQSYSVTNTPTQRFQFYRLG